MQEKFGRRRNEINDCWNGSAGDERNTIWPYWVAGTIAVAIIAVIAALTIGRLGV